MKNTDIMKRQADRVKRINSLAAVCLLSVAGSLCARATDGHTFSTDYARITIDPNGCISSIVAPNSGKEYSPVGHASPLLCLHESGQSNDKLLLPLSGAFVGETITLKYANGATVLLKARATGSYLRLQLVSLEPRGTVDNIVWGPLNTTLRGKMGDLIGVVRAPDFAIGMMGLDDNTIPGPV